MDERTHADVLRRMRSEWPLAKDEGPALDAAIATIEAARRVTAAFRTHGEAVPFTREAVRTRHECESAMLALDAALAQEKGSD